jgi:hypothetical protein
MLFQMAAWQHMASLKMAEAAETDGFLVEFITEQVGMGLEEAAGLLAHFREWRESLWREKYGDKTPKGDKGDNEDG